VNIAMPPLRQRPGDIPLLAMHFLRQFGAQAGREVVGFSESAMAALTHYAWPGNIRELENAVEHAVVLSRRPIIELDDLPESLRNLPGEHRARAPAADIEMSHPMPLDRALEGPERRIIHAALQRNNWNRQQTAAELNINRTTLYKKMRKYRLDLGE
jgi:DNA-binding NtrC family response regulator